VLGSPSLTLARSTAKGKVTVLSASPNGLPSMVRLMVMVNTSDAAPIVEVHVEATYFAA